MDTAITFIIAIIFGILQLILFFKIWGMTSNTKKSTLYIEMLAKHLCRDEYNKAHGSTLKVKGLTASKDDNTITFSDGVVGVLGKTEDGQYYITTDENHKYVYENIDFACSALHEYITNKQKLTSGLITLIKPKGVSIVAASQREY